MKYNEIPRQVMPCAYAECTNQATIRKSLIGSSYANLCIHHYDEQALEAALKWNHTNGLDSIEKRKEFIFKNKFSFKPIP